MKKPVLVTGASGFIGSALCQELLKKGHSVVGVSRHPAPWRATLPATLKKKYTQKIVDLQNYPKLLAAVEKYRPAVIFHIAALIDESAPEEKLFSVNTLGTLNLLEAASQAGVKKFIFSSSMSVYGSMGAPGSKAAPLIRRSGRRESDRPTPTSAYGRSKFSAEELCASYAAQKKLAVVALRYSGVYGPGRTGGRTGGAVQNFSQRALAGEELIVANRIIWDIVPLADVVQANILAWRTPLKKPFEIFNIGLGQPVDILKLAKIIIARSKMGSKLKITSKSLSFCLYYDITKAVKTLHYRPATLQQGIVDFLAYLKKK